MTTFTLRRINT